MTANDPTEYQLWLHPSEVMIPSLWQYVLRNALLSLVVGAQFQ